MDFLWSSETMIRGFCGYKIEKCSVGTVAVGDISTRTLEWQKPEFLARTHFPLISAKRLQILFKGFFFSFSFFFFSEKSLLSCEMKKACLVFGAEIPDRPFHDFRLSKFLLLKIADRRSVRLWNCERFGRVQLQHVLQLRVSATPGGRFLEFPSK